MLLSYRINDFSTEVGKDTMKDQCWHKSPHKYHFGRGRDTFISVKYLIALTYYPYIK